MITRVHDAQKTHQIERAIGREAKEMQIDRHNTRRNRLGDRLFRGQTTRPDSEVIRGSGRKT